TKLVFFTKCLLFADDLQYNLSRTYWQLQDIDKLTATIKESEQAIKFLKPKHKQLETTYLEYAKGGLAFLQKNNVAAQQHFTKALPAIQQNGDFTNEYVKIGRAHV